MPPDTWTTGRLLTWTTAHLERKGIDSPRVAAEMLLAHVLGCRRLALYMDTARPASELERAAFRELVERAVNHEPVDYLVGQAPFFSMMFTVSPAVLIPRPSTETLVEHILQHARRTPGFGQPTILDIGTGSGAIAVTLARHLPRAHVIATDLSADALAIARDNAERHRVADRIEFRHGHLYEPLAGIRAHYLISNPPYIPDSEWDAVAPNVRDHEPTTALRGGPDGLDLIRPLIAGAPDHMEQPGQLVVEIASVQRDAVLTLATAAGFTDPHILADHEALDRVLVASRG